MDKDIEQKLSHLDQRITDIKFAARNVLYVVAILFAGLAVYTAISVRLEISRLQDFEKNVRERINDIVGRAEGRPKLELFSRMGVPLEGKTVEGRLIKNKERGGFDLEFDVIIKNAGDKKTDPLTVKIYFRKPIKIHATPGTADEKDFDSELTFDLAIFAFMSFYPGVSIKYPLKAHIGSLEPPKEPVPAMLKIFYGGEKPCVSKFNLELKPS